MKKILIICILFSALLFAKEDDKYLNYVNQLINYHFDLKEFDKIKPPFEVEPTKVVNGKKMQVSQTLVKSIKVTLISIFNKNAYVMINEYLGNELIKKYYKWVKIGDKIGNCRVSNIMFDKLIMKCKNKILIKTLSKKIPNIKEQR